MGAHTFRKCDSVEGKGIFFESNAEIVRLKPLMIELNPKSNYSSSRCSFLTFLCLVASEEGLKMLLLVKGSTNLSRLIN